MSVTFHLRRGGRATVTTAATTDGCTSPTDETSDVDGILVILTLTGSCPHLSFVVSVRIGSTAVPSSQHNRLPQTYGVLLLVTYLFVHHFIHQDRRRRRGSQINRVPSN